MVVKGGNKCGELLMFCSNTVERWMYCFSIRQIYFLGKSGCIGVGF